ncbi:MAG: hypothetical protein J6K82_02330 [Alphaproteobacteria bacterium]|nr:hypothetical protein [Alphaproteobacteria bacterium]
MTSVSVLGLKADDKLYDRVVTAYRAGDRNDLIRLILEQYNWVAQLSHRLESKITYNQSRRLTVLYITLAKIANAVAGKGEYNLSDTRTNEIIGHRGWYVRDYILKDIVEKALPEFKDAQQMFIKLKGSMSPEYGVVQSVITAQDLHAWIEMYKQGAFKHKDTTTDSYFKDAQKVFRSIVSGRSVVLLTNDTLRALKDFADVFADEKNPMYKPEYEKAISEAARIVKQDIAELNNVTQQQLDR